MRVMHVDASPKITGSGSKMLSAYFIAQLQQRIVGLKVDYIDTSVQTPPHISHDFIEAMYTPAAHRNLQMKNVLLYSDNLCARVLMADMLVFAMPMYNFSMPSGFKALIDNLVRPGLTYVTDADGNITGNLSRQKVLFITTRGADLRQESSQWAHMDALTPALRSAFSFMGAENPSFVDVQPLEDNDLISKTSVLNRACLDLEAIAKCWINDFSTSTR